MNKNRTFWVCSVLIFYSLSVHTFAGTLEDSEQLFSPSVGQRFYEIACELANSDRLSAQQAQQAIIFLTATMNLDGRAGYVLPDVIKVVYQFPELDYSELVQDLLANYIANMGDEADLVVATDAVSYLLEQLDSREQREELLEQLLENLGGKNAALDSELACLLGLLMAEKADTEAAESYFMQAYINNKYNTLAFAKLAELAADRINPAIYLEQARLKLCENPLDIEAALSFAQHAERLQLYKTAADAYEYCADLFAFLQPFEALPASIYIPWAISNYNTRNNQQKCLEIAKNIRLSGRFDLFLEAIAGKAAEKIGEVKLANRLFQTAEEKARLLLENTDRKGRTQNSLTEADEDYTRQISAEQLAWFYCFASPDANKALTWANRAYSVEPNSATNASILAYSLVMNGQIEWARPLIDTYGEQTQIAALALAQIQLTEGQTEAAVETLQSVIARDPGALESERAKEIMAQQGVEYTPPIDPDDILAMLEDSLGQASVPRFISPEKIISIKLNTRGSEFSYDSEFDGAVLITNTSSEPLIISDDGLFEGNIRIDATVSGDFDRKIPNLLSVRLRPAWPVKPGRSILVALRLVTAELRRLLLAYPQASLDIEFTAYVDPVMTDNGRVVNKLRDIKPAKVVVKRPGIKLSSRYLRNRLNSLTDGQQNQKIKTAQLFAGLLMEQYAMTNREPLYKLMYASWMPDVLNSALLGNLTYGDWVVKTHTMAAMLSLPLNYELVNAMAESLNDTHWPARLMALYLLAAEQKSSFSGVLSHVAMHDSNKLVRDMALALGAAVPQSPVKEQANQLAPVASKE